MEIYINENRIAAPYVHVAITGGVCQIPMSSNEEAEKIAEKLNNTDKRMLERGDNYES